MTFSSLISRRRLLRAMPGSKLGQPATPKAPYFTTGQVVGNNGDGTVSVYVGGDESNPVNLPFHASYTNPQQGDIVRIMRDKGSGEVFDTYASTPLSPTAPIPNPPLQVQAGAMLYSGIGAPTFAANGGDRYYRTDTPGTSGQREYICTGGTSWTALTV